jgi:hypothetical protein
LSHETVYKLAHRADKANFSPKGAPTILTIVQSSDEASMYPQPSLN